MPGTELITNWLNLRVLSDKVPYFILDLLQQTPSVYVKGLGRFDAIFHPAEIDFGQSKIKPPFIEPGYSDQDSDPTNILPAYIQYASAVSIESSTQSISGFVDKVLSALHTDGAYSIEKFGTFSRLPTGGIRFTPDWDAFNLAFTGLEVLDLKSATEASKVSTPSVAPIPGIPVATVDALSDSTAVSVSVYPTDPLEESPAVIPSDSGMESGIAGNDFSNRLLWIILVLAMALITILCAYLTWDILSNRQRLREMKEIFHPQTSPTVFTEITTIPTDTGSVTTEVHADTLAVAVPESPKTTGEADCYIVVGAFSDPANASRMLDRLTSMNYMGVSLQGGNLTRIAIRTSCEPSSLQQVLNAARTSINPEAWIY